MWLWLAASCGALTPTQVLPLPGWHALSACKGLIAVSAAQGAPCPLRAQLAALDADCALSPADKGKAACRLVHKLTCARAEITAFVDSRQVQQSASAAQGTYTWAQLQASVQAAERIAVCPPWALAMLKDYDSLDVRRPPAHHGKHSCRESRSAVLRQVEWHLQFMEAVEGAAGVHQSRICSPCHQTRIEVGMSAGPGR